VKNSFVGKVLRLAVILLAANALYRFVPPYWAYTQFKNDLQGIALQAKGKSDDQLKSEMMALAERHHVPLYWEYIGVSRTGDRSHTYIETSWAEIIEFVPGWKYVWQFDVSADGWHVNPLGER
jgi:hypothetical protein